VNKLQTNGQPKRLRRLQQQRWVTSAAPLRFLTSRAFCFFAVCQLFFFELNPPLTEPAGGGTSEHVHNRLCKRAQRKTVAVSHWRLKTELQRWTAQLHAKTTPGASSAPAEPAAGSETSKHAWRLRLARHGCDCKLRWRTVVTDGLSVSIDALHA
jgi:hypothetical protein